jgi:hypothetical protein
MHLDQGGQDEWHSTYKAVADGLRDPRNSDKLERLIERLSDALAKHGRQLSPDRETRKVEIAKLLSTADWPNDTKQAILKDPSMIAELVISGKAPLRYDELDEKVVKTLPLLP